MKIAVIGAGISGLGAAWLLSKKHDVSVFEADNYFGGHANTVKVECPEGDVPVDTGFIVCNDRNYYNFLNLLDFLQVKYVPTEMSFGVSIGKGIFEYAGSEKLTSLIAQRRNLFRPRFIKMIKSILRFYSETAEIDKNTLGFMTLRDYLKQHGYDDTFVRDHILPMAAAVWSTPSNKVGDFPLSSFLRFCQNHGLLQIGDRPQWFTLPGGSQSYVKALIDKTPARFLKNTPIVSLRRSSGRIELTTKEGAQHVFDRVLLATHANTALKLVSDADDLEFGILSQFSYSKNRAVLHSDKRFMPKRKRAWASWNYIQNDEKDDSRLSVTYWMNRLQPLKTQKQLFVTLNPSQEPEEGTIHYEKQYDHPIFDVATLRAQKRLMEIMGRGNIWYAGAHFGYGFHEDGLQSGLYAAEQMDGMARPWYSETMNNRIIALHDRKEPLHPIINEAAE